MAKGSALAIALERRDWSLAALCLLLGVAEVASRLPPETLEALLELLEEGLDDRRRR
jgi:hypothetical protein